MLGRDGRAGIAHLKRHLTRAALDGHPDALAVGGVAQRIGQQVRQRPAQHQQIALNRTGTGQLEAHPALVGRELVIVQQLRAQSLQRDGFGVRHDQPVIRLGQKQHVVDHPRHALQLLQVRMQVVLILIQRARAGQRHLGVGHQIAQRRAQLVGDVGGEVRQPHEGVFQPRQHGVEGLHQLLQLGRCRLVGDALAQGFGRDRGGHLGDLAQRSQPATHQQPAEQAAEHRAEYQRAPQPAAEGMEERLVHGDIEQDQQRQRRLTDRHLRHLRAPEAPIQ